MRHRTLLATAALALTLVLTWLLLPNRSTPSPQNSTPPPLPSPSTSSVPTPSLQNSTPPPLPPPSTHLTSASFTEVLAWVASLPPAPTDSPVPADLLPLLLLRADTLRQWITTAPESALQAALTPHEYAKLPPAARPFFERPLAGTGSFNVLALCNHSESPTAHGPICQTLHQVDLDGQSYIASVYGSRVFRLSENTASLYGIALGDTLALHADDAVVFPASRLSSDPSRASHFAVIHHGQPTFFPDLATANQHAATLNR